LAFAVSAVAMVAYFMLAEPKLSTNERTAGASSSDFEWAAKQPAGSATNPPASPAATSPTAADQTVASAEVRQLDRDEVAMLAKRGEQFAMVGDVAAARLILQRAAEAGDPRASLSLAATYDPIVLERLGVRGISADIAMARTWYEKAKDFGSDEASRLLERLASRDQ
jgi:TPR repeat protein